jgi:flagellar export protein FliJ
MFNFRLQRVLDLRERREQETAVRLAGARQEVDAAQAEHGAIEQARADGRSHAAEAAGAGACSMGELQFMSAVLAHLDTRAEESGRAVRAAEAVADSTGGEFSDAVRDRRALDKLKDRQRDAWEQVQSLQDRQTMDAVALMRYVGRAGGER